MGRQRDSSQIARDRRRIAELYLHGALQVEIAKELGINQSTVSRDLKALHAEWLASALVDISEAKSRELARLDDLERTYWAGWQRSQDPVEVINKRAVETHAGRRITVNTQSSDQVGDPRFLAGVGWCIEQRCKLLGIASPERLDLTTGGMPLTPKTVTMIAPVSLPQLEGGEFTYDRPDTE